MAIYKTRIAPVWRYGTQVYRIAARSRLLIKDVPLTTVKQVLLIKYI